MIIQINLDTITWRHNNQSHTIPREDSEYILGEKLAQLHRATPLWTIYVLNWPGSFTNLRLGSIVINTLAHLSTTPITLYSLSKSDFWHTCFTHDAIGQYGVLYIWQKKNARLFDALAQTHEKKTLVDLYEKADLFYENIGTRESDKKTQLSFDEATCTVTLWNKQTAISLEAFPWSTVDSITPEYVIEPNISAPKKNPFVS